MTLLKTSKNLAVALCLTVCAQTSLHAQGTALTYQGRLDSSGTPANGSYDVQFTLYATNTTGVAVAGPVTNTAVHATNGLFTTTVDFGAGVFTGTNYWLELAVSTNGANAFSTLAPRQQLTPVPYAIFANSASNLLGTLAAAQLSGPIANANLPSNPTVSGTVSAGSFNGDGSGLVNLNASQLASGTVPDARLAGNVARTNQVWLLTGNSGTMPPVNFLGTADNQPLIIKVNSKEAFRFEPTADTPNVVGGYSSNSVQSGLYGVTIAGGGTAMYGGVPNVVISNGNFATIGGGNNNTVANYGGTIAGGLGNTVGAYAAMVGAGQYNNAQSTESVIGGGQANFVAANSDQSVIAGGFGNVIQPYAVFASIGGGANNSVQTNSPSTTIAGGYHNAIAYFDDSAAIGGGSYNSISNNSDHATIAGGSGNVIQPYAVLASIGGGAYNLVETNSPSTTIGGGYNNAIANFDDSATIGGGAYNSISNNSDHAVIGGGIANAIQSGDFRAVIGGGILNVIQSGAHDAVVSGGYANTVQFQAINGVISGGYTNTILTNAQFAAIGGGVSNAVAGSGGVVPGGVGNAANGSDSFAAGTFAQATNDGAFVLTDDGPTNFYSTASNQLSARFTGGIVLVTGGAGITLDGQPMLTGDYNGAVSLANSSNSFSGGSFSGNGGGLTNLQISAVGPAGTFGLMSDYFSSTQTVPVNYPFFLTTADVNGDDKPDLITADRIANTLTVLTNNGSGVFGSNATLVVGPQPAAVVAVTNFNGHGGVALVSANSGTNTLTIWTNNGITAFKLYGTMVVSDTTNFPHCVVAADVNGDGKPDLVCLNSSSKEVDTLTVLTNNGNGGFGSNSLVRLGATSGTFLLTADVNGDGRPDLVVLDDFGVAFGAFTNNGNGGFGTFYFNNTFVNPANYSALYHLSAIAATDVNGDGRPDLLLVSYAYDFTTNFVSENDLLVLTNNGAGFGFSGIYNVAPTNGGNGIISCAVGDINGDGKPDVIVGNNTPGAPGTLTVMLNNGNGAFSYSATEGAGSDPVSVVAADFNGDGKTDLASANYGDGTVSVLLGASLIQSTLTVTDIVSMTNGLNSFGGTFNGAVDGNGAGLTNVNAATLNGLPASAFAPANGSTNYIQNQTSAPQPASFNISGNAIIGGQLFSGSGLGTSDPPSKGLVIRRVNSLSATSGNVVARTDVLDLERDGSNEGMVIVYPAGVSRQTINCVAQSYYGTNIIVNATLNGPASPGGIQLFTSAQHVVHAEINFGNTYGNGHFTKVSIDRYDDGTYSDNYWVGTLTSTYNQ